MNNNNVEGKTYGIIIYVLVFILGVMIGVGSYYIVKAFVKSGIDDRKAFDKARSSITTTYQYADNSINNRIKFL